MIEELYIITQSGRKKVDLNVPSGITLSFKSNMFCDLSSIASSNSYTFNLPKTPNNCALFNNVQDVRVANGDFGNKYNMEFYINGICVIPNGFIYVDNVTEKISAVMTWNVVEQLQSISDDDISIRELPHGEESIATPISSLWSSDFRDSKYNVLSFDNEQPYLTPYYRNGVDREDNYRLQPLPVVPVRYIIKKIEQKYGIQFDTTFSRHMTARGTNPSTALNTILHLDKAVLPCVRQYLPDNIVRNNDITLLEATTTIGMGNNSPKTALINSETAGYIIVFKRYTGGVNLSSPIYSNNDKVYLGFQPNYVDSSFTVNIVIKLYVEHTTEDVTIEIGGTTITGKKLDETHYIDGVRCDVVTFGYEGSYEDNEISITPEIYPQIQYVKCSRIVHIASGKMSIKHEMAEGQGSRMLDTIESLPDISVLTFLKGLFYQIGSYPYVKDGKICAMRYENVYANFIDQTAVDWSNYLVGNVEEISMKVGGFGINNYYALSSDKLPNDKNEQSEDDDVYASQYKNVVCNNKVLEKHNTVITLPYYGPFTKNGKYKDIPTGNTLKYWEGTSKEYSASESKPCFGLVVSKERIESVYSESEEDFVDVSKGFYLSFNTNCKVFEDNAFNYISKLIKTPKVIKAKFIIPEIELEKLNYSIPVYIKQLSSYFAIIDIEYSNGFSVVQLLRLDINTVESGSSTEGNTNDSTEDSTNGLINGGTIEKNDYYTKEEALDAIELEFTDSNANLSYESISVSKEDAINAGWSVDNSKEDTCLFVIHTFTGDKSYTCIFVAVADDGTLLSPEEMNDYFKIIQDDNTTNGTSIVDADGDRNNMLVGVYETAEEAIQKSSRLTKLTDTIVSNGGYIKSEITIS